MDISKYSQKKENKLVEIIALGNSFALVSKRFDPDTGEQMEDQIITVEKAQLEEQRDDLRNRLNQVEDLLGDIEKTEGKPKLAKE